MGELLLELLTEEIPARMQRRAIDDLRMHLDEWLQSHRLRATTIQSYVTPRRLTLIADGIPARQPDDNEEKRGPRIGSPDQAVAGFLRSVDLTSIDQCEVRDDRYFAVIKKPGREAAKVLPDVIEATLNSMTWPKSMRYPASELRWVRPLNSVVCLFDGEVLSLPLGGVPVGRVTRGHRFLSDGEIAVVNAVDYREKLGAAHVVLDWNERRATIAAGLDKLAADEGLTVKPDEGLLDEVTGLVEYPVVLMGSIDPDFVRPLPDGLPPEVLATAMRTHQKYFSCLSADETPAPRFLFVANNVTADKGAAIVAGNERVLRARLSDAKFFWDQDRKVRLEDRVEALKQRVYHEKLGSVYDKVERMEKLAEYLANYVPGADPALARRGARLAKADLSTGMVGEFPELQGVMGRYYALNDGQDSRVADAIGDHYKPLGPNDGSPTAPLSAAVAFADKFDSIAAFFSAGLRPTGSGDQFALRRAAQGIIRTILEGDFQISLAQAFAYALLVLAEQKTVIRGEGDVRSDELVAFVISRLEIHLRERGVRADLVRAARNQIANDGADLLRFRARVRALEAFIDTDDGSNMLTAYRRASNIVNIEERRDGVVYDEYLDPQALREPAEKNLNHALGEVGGFVGILLRSGDFQVAMSAMSALRQPIDEFFERVTVNAPEKELRENRLRLLARIRSTMNQIADFSQIEG